ncbi:putative peptidase A1 family protein [Lyophyllum shimeji]|uniref:Peptidase A1 family protein n=1 Tax=Lyophyllum shimeji TaxID=47721 RepID=A0A9P3UHV0_LYOSH|nr:putative peptidase A1 family protein [Lyophyllum shimeji]
MRLSFPVAIVVLGTSLPLASSIPRRDGITIPLAKRTTLAADGHGVVRVKTLQDQLASASRQQGFQALRKNTGSVLPDGDNKRRFVKRAEGSLPLTNDNGALWYGEVAVGMPEETFTVVFDTGSSDFFLPSQDCNSNGCNGHKRYDPTASLSATPLHRKFQISFGDGSTVEGDIYNDTVSVAGLTANGQAVGAALTYSDNLSVNQFPPDGLVGMAFKEISQFGSDPLFETLVAQGETTAPQFGFKLADPASVYLGGVVSNLFTGQLTWTPVTQKGFWHVGLEGVNVNAEPIFAPSSAIIDTGSTLVLGNTSSVANFYDAIPGSKDAYDTAGEGFYTCASGIHPVTVIINPLLAQVPCNASLDISLTFGGKEFRFDPKHFNLGRVSQGSEDCVGGVAAKDDADLYDAWLVGATFLQGIYTAFDVAQQAVGFATLA